jgi:hypothetical protein
MIMTVEGNYPTHVKVVHVSMQIGEPTYSPSCPKPTRLHNNKCEISAEISTLQISGRALLKYDLSLDWPADIPYSTKGSYANVYIPGIKSSYPMRPIIDRARYNQELTASGVVSVPQLAMLQGSSPTTPGPLEWAWSTTGPMITQESFTLTDIAGVASDSRRVFYSGIALGVAGSALIALIEQLLQPLRRTEAGDQAEDSG